MSEPPEETWSEQWLASAEADLKAAEHLLALQDDEPFSIICFHAQQAAEKYLKAVLVWGGQDVPRTHDLRRLAQLAVEAAASEWVDVAEILPLNRYAVETRYPGFWEPIDSDEATEALRLARTVRVAAHKLLLPKKLE